jgi:hypothetical protein
MPDTLAVSFSIWNFALLDPYIVTKLEPGINAPELYFAG